VGETCNTHAGDKLSKILVGKAEGVRRLGRPKHRWEDNIKMDFKGVKCDGVYCIHLYRNRIQ